MLADFGGLSLHKRLREIIKRKVAPITAQPSEGLIGIGNTGTSVCYCMYQLFPVAPFNKQVPAVYFQFPVDIFDVRLYCFEGNIQADGNFLVG